MPIAPLRAPHTDRSDSADVELEGGSQAVKAQQRLRELILAGHLPAGTRIAELALVERLADDLLLRAVRRLSPRR